MTIGLVGHQLVQVGLLEEEDVARSERLLPYLTLHDNPAFLSCPLAAGASYRDLKFISGIRELRQQDQAIADRVLHSLKCQTWYLNQPWLVTALVGREVPVEEKAKIVLALYSTPRPDSYPPFCCTPELPKQKVHLDPTYWPEDGSLPSLSPMVGPRTWQILEILGLHGSQVEWLRQDPGLWEANEGYRRLEDFVTRLEVTNDGSERDVKLIQV